MPGSGSDPDGSDNPEFTGREEVLRFLERSDVHPPDGLTVEKIRHRGGWWIFDDESFSFRMERHPTPFPTGESMPTPARWHVRTRYTYDLATDEWEVVELHREFEFEPGVLVDAEFERGARDRWDAAVDRVQAADELEAVFAEEMASTAEKYRSMFPDVSEDRLEEMLDVIRAEFRRRAGLD
jgi:hypothetical protein